MDVRGAVLAILTMGPCYGNQIVAELSRRTGETVNPGHVSRTLQRLADSGAVRALERDVAGRIPYALTEAGEVEADRLMSGATGDVAWIAFLATIPGVDARVIIARQRVALDALEAGLGEPYGLAALPKRGRPTRPL